jgi:CBS domain-containing protein
MGTSKAVLVRDVMARNLITLHPEQDIYVAIDSLLKNRVSGAPVVDKDGNLAGIISEKDCLRVFASGAFYQLGGGIVGDFMSKTVLTVDPDDDVFKVADIFMKNHFRRLPVVKDGKLVGLISRRDVLTASLKILEQSPVKKPWTDSKYLTPEMRAALGEQEKSG